MHGDYQINALRELRDQQVRYAPRDKKIEQSMRAERLLREIEPDKHYSYRFLCVGITDFRSEMHPDLMIDGESVRCDLLLLIEDLFDSADISVDEVDEKVWTIREISVFFNVSEKTVSRWRKHGLVSRRFLFGNKKRVGFLDSSVRYFQETNNDRVDRGQRFSQLSQEEKQLIIRTARRFADTTTSPTEVAKRIARYLGRSVETVRYTLKSFDERNADIPLFPNRHSPLDREVKKKIFQEYRRAVPIEKLAANYRRTRGSIYRIIGQMRAERIGGFALDYIDSPEFHNIGPEKEKMFLGPPVRQKKNEVRKNVSPNRFGTMISRMERESPTFVEIPPENDAPVQAARTESTEPADLGLPAYLSGLYKIPLLGAEEETHLFRKLNYLKYKASTLRDRHDPIRPNSHLMGRIEKLYDMAVTTKNEIVSANLRLVVSIAKRHIGIYSNFFELVSDGNLALLRAVEKFDYSRGNRFSTYATWAITRHFARSIPDEKKRRDMLLLSDDEILVSTEDRRSNLQIEEKTQFERERQIGLLLNKLDEREQKIIVSRFGIGQTQEPRTLNEVGVEMGVTKERIRQIEARALAKLRKVAEEEHLEIPGL